MEKRVQKTVSSLGSESLHEFCGFAVFVDVPFMLCCVFHVFLPVLCVLSAPGCCWRAPAMTVVCENHVLVVIIFIVSGRGQPQLMAWIPDCLHGVGREEINMCLF